MSERSELPNEMTHLSPEVTQLPLRERLGNTFAAVKTDYRESPSKIQNIAVGAGVLALQGLDRARVAVIFVPTIAVDVLQSSHSPVEAAVAGGAAFTAWCAAVGGITNEGLHKYPKAVKQFEESFPGAVDFFNDALPGIEQPSPEEPKRSRAKRIGSRVLTGVRRGYTVSGIGTAAYVSTAAVSGKSKAETHKLNLHASLDGGAAIGAVIFGAGEAIVQLSHSNPALAEHIQHDASNIKLWYGVAAAMMVGQFVSNKFKKLRNRSGRSAKPEDESANLRSLEQPLNRN